MRTGPTSVQNNLCVWIRLEDTSVNVKPVIVLKSQNLGSSMCVVISTNVRTQKLDLELEHSVNHQALNGMS